MSQTETAPTDTERTASDDEPEQPDIEDDLVKETLKIDGICGVY